MSMLREFAGWALVAWIATAVFVGFVTLGSFMREGEVFFGLGFSAFVLIAMIPGFALTAYRFLSADPVALAEADGRRPVLLLSSFTRFHTPWFLRAIPGPALLEDYRDALYNRAMHRTFRAVGPVIPFPRPKPPPAHGPVRDMGDPEWEAELAIKIDTAALIGVVLDGTENNIAELVAIVERNKGTKTFLIPPRKIDKAFLERWEKVRKRFGDLPAIEQDTVAIRFQRDGKPLVLTSGLGTPAAREKLLGEPAAMLSVRELRARPKPPALSWLFTLLPIPVAFVGAIATPIFLEGAHNASLDGEEVFTAGVGIVFLSVILSMFARRAVALVPANDMMMLFVASFPWWFLLFVGWADELVTTTGPIHDLDRFLLYSAVGAAYSAPLLWSTALVLGLATLMRKSPGRRISYGVFGIATLIPFGALALSLIAANIPGETLLVALFFGAIALALIAMSASGDAPRRHAPMPLGAACAAALAIAAWAYAISNLAWRGNFSSISSGTPAYGDPAVIDTLTAFSSAWPWFTVAIPVAIVFIALPFRGRANRSSAMSVLAFLPVLFIIGWASATQAAARERVEEHGRMWGGEIFETVREQMHRPEFSPVVLTHNPSAGPIDLFVDDGGVFFEGERIATASVLMGAPGWGGPRFARTMNTLAARLDGRRLRFSADQHTQAIVLATTVESMAANWHADYFEFIGTTPQGGPAAFNLIASGAGSGTIAVDVTAGDVAISHNRGRSGRCPHPSGTPDLSCVGALFQQVRAVDPGHGYVVVRPHPGATVSQYIAVAEALGNMGVQIMIARP